MIYTSNLSVPKFLDASLDLETNHHAPDTENVVGKRNVEPKVDKGKITQMKSKDIR